MPGLAHQPRTVELIKAELRSIRAINDDARAQLDSINTKLRRGSVTATEYAALCDHRDRLLLGIEARRGKVDRLLDEWLEARKAVSA